MDWWSLIWIHEMGNWSRINLTVVKRSCIKLFMRNFFFNSNKHWMSFTSCESGIFFRITIERAMTPTTCPALLVNKDRHWPHGRLRQSLFLCPWGPTMVPSYYLHENEDHGRTVFRFLHFLHWFKIQMIQILIVALKTVQWLKKLHWNQLTATTV